MENQNKNLLKAKKQKNDAFYTQILDIEHELKYYKDHFKSTIVFCNCDDPEYSNFWKFYPLEFECLGLKKLITTHYDASEPTYKMEYENGNAADISVGIITPLRTYDDFRSPEGVNLMEQADIICANPPFFLFYEYVAQLTAYGFIINLLLSIGNLNVVKTEMSFLIFLMAVFGWVLLVLIVVQH